jgi:hypothetical protein
MDGFLDLIFKGELIPIGVGRLLVLYTIELAGD